MYHLIAALKEFLHLVVHLTKDCSIRNQFKSYRNLILQKFYFKTHQPIKFSNNIQEKPWLRSNGLNFIFKKSFNAENTMMIKSWF